MTASNPLAKVFVLVDAVRQKGRGPLAITDEQLAEVLERADELFIGAMNEDAAPGMGVGIVRGSETIYTKGFGLADSGRERPVSPRTVFRIGSISKTMTAIGLMQLWEQGFFGLDDPVNDHLKHYQVNRPDRATPPVTFRRSKTIPQDSKGRAFEASSPEVRSDTV